MDAAGAPLFRMEGVSKRYGGVRALEKAELRVERGRVHAILGENGAGKSTLIKIMAGVVEPDEGRMLLEGTEVDRKSTRLNSSHLVISYAVFCWKKNKNRLHNK